MNYDYISKALNDSLVCNKLGIEANTPFIELYLEEIVKYDSFALKDLNKDELSIFIDAANNYLIDNDFSNILLKFKSTEDHENMTVDEIQKMIKCMELIFLCDWNSNFKFNISDEDSMSIHNYINKQFLLSESNQKNYLEDKYKILQLYNFGNFYLKACNLKKNIFYCEFFITKKDNGNSYNDGSISLTKYGIDREYFKCLDTIFHEAQHQIQNIELESLYPNKYSLIYQIEEFLREKDEIYYDDNYYKILKEVDARYNAAINLIIYIECLFTDSEINKIGQKDFDNRFGIRRLFYDLKNDEQLYNYNINLYREKSAIDEYDILIFRDAALDKFIKDDPSLLQKSELSFLSYIYNSDGSRKTFFELYDAMRKETNKEIKEMYAYWIKTSEYGFESFIQNCALLASYKSGEFNQYCDKLTEAEKNDIEQFFTYFYTVKKENFIHRLVDNIISSEYKEVLEAISNEINKYKNETNKEVLEVIKNEINKSINTEILEDMQTSEFVSNSYISLIFGFQTDYTIQQLDAMEFSEFLNILAPKDVLTIFSNKINYEQFMDNPKNLNFLNSLPVSEVYNYVIRNLSSQEDELSQRLILKILFKMKNNDNFLNYMFNQSDCNDLILKLFNNQFIKVFNIYNKYSSVENIIAKFNTFSEGAVEPLGTILTKLTGEKFVIFENIYNNISLNGESTIYLFQQIFSEFFTQEQIEFMGTKSVKYFKH